MVDAVTPISATTASAATRIGTSTSITSEPDNAWVAARQSQITADRQALTENHPHRPHDATLHDDRQPDEREAAGSEQGAENAPDEHPTFSGESDRIGTQNFDEDTPFGDRVAIV